MKYLSRFLTTTLVAYNTLVFIYPIAYAGESIAMLRNLAEEITVEIKSIKTNESGSGVLLQRQGNIYTILTAAHVVTRGESFTVKTVDSVTHKSLDRSVITAGNNVDLAVLKFESPKNYQLAKIGNSNELELGSEIYVAGFPVTKYSVESGVLNFTSGKITGKSAPVNKDGYSLIYNNLTNSGMSGGAVLNTYGELVAIHGLGDREGEEGEGEKTGRNLGIVIERFGIYALSMGVKLDQKIAALAQGRILSEYDYLNRAEQKIKARNFLAALNDYDQAISFYPKSPLIYTARGELKENQLNDLNGAITDYNQAILAWKSHHWVKEGAINVNAVTHNIYITLGNLKSKKMNDINGAVVDYNQAVSIYPDSIYPYIYRGELRKDKLNNQAGAIQDFRKAIQLIKKENKDKYNKYLPWLLDQLRILGVTG
jgi:tetratricopeptide (TPR) repeat protein